METDEKRAEARKLAQAAIDRDQPMAWFEELYVQAGGDPSRIPWADLEANPELVDWFEDHPKDRGEALVVGCGLGDDAEFLMGHCQAVVAFDISATAIEWCRKRFPQSKVCYQVADVLALPDDFKGRFNFVLESNTLQTVPAELRPPMIHAMAETLAPGGELLMTCRAREAHDAPGKMPWPLTRGEVDLFKMSLQEESFLDFKEDHVRRFRVLYRKS